MRKITERLPWAAYRARPHSLIITVMPSHKVGTTCSLFPRFITAGPRGDDCVPWLKIRIRDYAWESGVRLR